MVFACGLSQYSVGIFHLMNHAFFKALLFLSAGSVIHALADEQDMRKMGGLAQLLPFTFAMMSIGSLALVGFPFLTGFYSKDVILECAYAKYTLSGNFASFFGNGCVFLTSYYSFRLLFLTFLAPPTGYKSSVKTVHEAPFLMAVPLLILALGSVFVGYLAKDMMIGLGTPFWSHAFFVLPKNSVFLESEFIPQTQKFLPFFFTLFGAGFASLMILRHTVLSYLLKTSVLGKTLYTFLNKRWFFDKVYNDFLSENALRFGYTISFKTLDKGSFEILGPKGLAYTFLNLTQYMSQLQSGMIYHYAVVMLVGLTCFISFISVWEWFDLFVDFSLPLIYLVSFFFFNYYSHASKLNGM